MTRHVDVHIDELVLDGFSDLGSSTGSLAVQERLADALSKRGSARLDTAGADPNAISLKVTKAIVERMSR